MHAAVFMSQSSQLHAHDSDAHVMRHCMPRNSRGDRVQKSFDLVVVVYVCMYVCRRLHRPYPAMDINNSGNRTEQNKGVKRWYV
jgi:hypothetical protein